MKKVINTIINALSKFWNWLHKGFKLFICIIFFAFGLFGGVGYTLYNNAVPCAVGVLALALMAAPTLVRAWRDYQEG